MKKPFGKGSWTRKERSVWEIWYGPVRRTYDEVGLEIYLSPKDAAALEQTLATAAGIVGFSFANVLGAFAGFVPIAVGYFVKNDDGSLSVHIAPHGFQVGMAPAADPNVFAPVAWAPVRRGLEALNRGAAVDEADPEGADQAVAYHGSLLLAHPEQEDGGFAPDPVWEGATGDLEAAFDHLDVPERVRAELRPEAGCVAGGTSTCTREWENSCRLPDNSLGRWVTLTCVFYNPDGKECDRKVQSWCSPGSPVAVAAEAVA